ncbi:MAG: hypothetical protein CMN05_01570 [Roseibacillus sp.]|nr:hypothetical protein [Roseibacillus sp.]
MDLVTRLLMVSALALPVISAKPTFEKSGVVIIPRADCRADGGKLSAGFRATRWGMYDLMIEGTADAGLKAMLNGQGPVAAGSRPGHLGSYYMEKAGPCVIELNGTAGEVTALRLVPACEGRAVMPEKGKAIELDARDCRISGVMLRYEPKPKKLCIGFRGNPEDYPVWNYTVVTPGRYEVVLTQGCGRGAGGSKAVLETAGTSLEFTVKDTGGYQNWIDVSLGEVTFAEAGSQQLSVKVLKKARGIMDIRRIVLKPVK